MGWPKVIRRGAWGLKPQASSLAPVFKKYFNLTYVIAIPAKEGEAIGFS